MCIHRCGLIHVREVCRSREHGGECANVSLLHERTIKERIETLEQLLPGFQSGDVKRPFSVLDPRLLVLCLMGDGALLSRYKRQKSRCAVSQAELVFQILREGVQSAHSQIPALLYSGGDSLKDILENCMGEHEPLQEVTKSHQVCA